MLKLQPGVGNAHRPFFLKGHAMKVIDGDLNPAATAKSPKHILWAEIEALQDENNQLQSQVNHLNELLAAAKNAAGIAEYQTRLIREVLTITGTRPAG